MCATRMKNVSEKCACDTESVYTIVAHTLAAATWVRNSVGTTPTTKIVKKSSLHDHLERIPSDILQVLFDLSPGLGPLVCFPPCSDSR